mgnify:FL=1|jgi:uncharacterized protein (TIGR03084 family)|tara:strand:+ start:53 stop:856 length:804 start_codon:yes stop_codon:yes gene_type:complete
MKTITNDIREEVAELNSLLNNLSTEQWETNTTFKDWTPIIVISHLCYFDLMTLYSINDSDKFASEGQFIMKTFSTIENSLARAAAVKERLNIKDHHDLKDLWLSTNDKMCSVFEKVDPKLRCQWFGPDMGARMFMTARYMETWSHGQEIYDLVKRKRLYTDSIKNIADIGVKTFDWTYINRKLDVPFEKPFVSLTSPSGEQWQWNDENSNNTVIGQASDFCHVVTQNRNIADTKLMIHGDVAKHWMSIAQCFAGDPESPPDTGIRVS